MSRRRGAIASRRRIAALSYKRGIVLGGGEGGFSTVTNTTPGTYGSQWFYEPTGSYAYLAGRGHKVVLVLFMLERLFASPSSATFVSTELQRLKDQAAYAAANGMQVIIQPFNKGAYCTTVSGTRTVNKIGSTTYTQAMFNAHMVALSNELETNAGVYALGLMNEPYHLTNAECETVMSSAIDAIRGAGWSTSAGAGKKIIVPTSAYSGVHDLSTRHPSGPWKAGDDLIYEIHHYWDADHSGAYVASYSTENTNTAVAAGAYPDKLHARVIGQELNGAITWAAGRKLWIGEYGVPNRGDLALEEAELTQWKTLLNAYLARCDEAGINATAWLAGSTSFGTIWQLYESNPAGSYGPALSIARPQAATIEAHPTVV